jgi:hypothetical protein
MMMQRLFEGVTPVSTYTRADAIGDGVLVDASIVAKEAGFTCPVAVTKAVWSDCVKWGQEDTKRQAPQDEEGRLWDVIYMCLQTARYTKVEGAFYFILYRIPRGGRGRKARLTRLKAHIGPGDDGEGAITIMKPDES